MNDSCPLYGSIAAFLQYAIQALRGLLHCFHALGANDAIFVSTAASVKPVDLNA